MGTCNLLNQAMAANPLEEALVCPTMQPQQQQQQEKKLRPQPEQALSCPRCNSTNTKFCYYNNYSLSQPRYFCKSCRRYWTKGGSLRNVPVGGGCRKNKRPSSSSKKMQVDQNPTSFSAFLPSLLPPPPPFILDPHDFTLAFSTLHTAPELGGHDELMLGNHGPSTIPPQAPSFLDILRTGFLDSGASASDDPYYGFGAHHGSMEEEVEGGAGGEQAVRPLDALGGATAFAKQESSSCKNTADGDSRLFMGMEWQVGGDGSKVMNPGRDYWNGVSPSWHGLVNSFHI